MATNTFFRTLYKGSCIYPWPHRGVKYSVSLTPLFYAVGTGEQDCGGWKKQLVRSDPLYSMTRVSYLPFSCFLYIFLVFTCPSHDHLHFTCSPETFAFSEGPASAGCARFDKSLSPIWYYRVRKLFCPKPLDCARSLVLISSFYSPSYFFSYTENSYEISIVASVECIENDFLPLLSSDSFSGVQVSQDVYRVLQVDDEGGQG
jgi:hypothetical protein